MAEKVQLGSRSGVLLEFTPESSQKYDPSLVWGEGRLLMGGVPVIAVDNDEPFVWTWIDLLEWLARSWPFLLLEQSFPFQVPTVSAAAFLGDLEKRWESMAEERVEEEEEEAHRFLSRHDLASAFKGIFFPSVYIMRQGHLMEVICAESMFTQRLSLASVVDDLQAIGDGLASRAVVAGEDRHGRGGLAVQRWHERGQKLDERALPLLTGLPSESLEQINPSNDSAFWEYDSSQPLADTELMAAARMTTGALLPEQQRQIVEAIRETPKGLTPELDAVSETIQRAFKEIGKPHDQGYWAAGRLRQALSIHDNEAVDPGRLLKQWCVGVHNLKIPDSRLDALACWGPKHGPAIFINRAYERTPSHVHGENSTLAHEICHLLLDRGTTLPLAEVFNGNTPERLEKRARAFAAELLLPRRVAAERVRRHESVQRCVTELSEMYQVSPELVGWQITNSEVYSALSAAEQNRISLITDRRG